MNVQELLKKYRKEAGLTQKQVADKINVSRNTYTQYENGTRRIDVETFGDILNALEIQLSFREWKSIEKKIHDLNEAKLEWEELRNEMFKAIYDLDYMKIKELLEAGIEPDIRDEENERAFITAVKFGAHEIVKLFLKYGAKYKTKWDYENEDDWERPLTMAAESGFYGVVKVLLEYGIDPDDNISYGPTPLQSTFLNGRYDIVRLLIQHEADINIKCYRGSIVKRLIEKKDDNMLLYIKEKYFYYLNHEQEQLLENYLAINTPIETRKDGHMFHWVWSIYDSKNFDEISNIIEHNFRKEQHLELNTLLKLLTKKYKNDKQYLYAIALYSFKMKEPVIYVELKEILLQKLEWATQRKFKNKKDLENLYEKIIPLDTYQ